MSIETRATNDTGSYWVTTHSGTRHLLNLDDWTITRYPDEGHEWTSKLLTPDEASFRFDTMNSVAVGKCMQFTAMTGEWRISSTIQSIEAIVEGEQ